MIRRALAGAALTGLLVGPAALLGQAPAPGAPPPAAPAAAPTGARPAHLIPPTTRTPDCTTAGCHSSQVNHRVLHGPAAVGACDACHDFADVSRHTFTLKRQGADLCSFCHIGHTGREGTLRHEPFAKGDCLACHNPHGGAARTLLKKDPMPALCADCHKDVLKGTHIHGPAATDCSACHKPHHAQEPRLLLMEKRALCLHCHTDIHKTITTARHPHDPIAGDCLQCHAPHAANEPKILKLASADLCLSCHENVGKTAGVAAHAHAPMSDSRACLNCHVAHGSDHAKQLTKDTLSTCMACHDKPIRVDGNRTVLAVAELTNPALFKHGPAAKGECAGCHGVHGAPQPDLLERRYSDSFYQPFSDEAYALCFKCHDPKLTQSTETGTETGFRDGTRNLHHLHVAKGPQGRSCRACHTVHASRFEAQIADHVTYGNWKLPINFVPAETGGSCAPGCHKVERYDRGASTAPITLPPAAPTPPQPPPK